MYSKLNLQSFCIQLTIAVSFSVWILTAGHSMCNAILCCCLFVVLQLNGLLFIVLSVEKTKKTFHHNMVFEPMLHVHVTRVWAILAWDFWQVRNRAQMLILWPESWIIFNAQTKNNLLAISHILIASQNSLIKGSYQLY